MGKLSENRWNSAQGFTLVEILITLAIFSILTAGIYSAFSSQVRHYSREYRVAASDIEDLIASDLLERDVALAGFGYAEDYSNLPSTIALPNAAVQGADILADSDDLWLYGTALSIENVSSQRWMYNSSAGLAFPSEVSERLQGGDYAIALEPNGRKLLDDNGEWLFKLNGTSLFQADGDPPNSSFPPTGTIFYGMKKAPAIADQPSQPFYSVHYYLGGSSFPSVCAPGTKSLQRDESADNLLFSTATGLSRVAVAPNPMLSCVRDFQVVFQLDTDDDGILEPFNAGALSPGTSTYTSEEVRKYLNRINAYILVQVGARDNDYVYPSSTIWVGEAGKGREVTLTDAQRKYRWRVLSVEVTPRNLR